MRSSKRNAGITSPARSESDSRATDTKRRGFLLALGAGGIGAAAIAARSLSGVAPNAAATPDDDSAKGAGYRATDHVKRYYETTKT
ncbi:MAG TPA: formate dehydrogenase [Casimicrobiaceae bacterium]|jgi:hypothetical protein